MSRGAAVHCSSLLCVFFWALVRGLGRFSATPTTCKLTTFVCSVMDAVRSASVSLAGKSARGLRGRDSSGLGSDQQLQHPPPEEAAGSGGLTETGPSRHPGMQTDIDSAPTNPGQPLEGSGNNVQI